MADFGTAGGSKAEPDCKPLVGSNLGEPARPDTNDVSSVVPPALPTFGNNDANKAK